MEPSDVNLLCNSSWTIVKCPEWPTLHHILLRWADDVMIRWRNLRSFGCVLFVQLIGCARDYQQLCFSNTIFTRIDMQNRGKKYTRKQNEKINDFNGNSWNERPLCILADARASIYVFVLHAFHLWPLKTPTNKFMKRWTWKGMPISNHKTYRAQKSNAVE